MRFASENVNVFRESVKCSFSPKISDGFGSFMMVDLVQYLSCCRIQPVMDLEFQTFGG